MNKLTIIGNLTRDPETRQVNTVNGPVSVCSFTVAVNRRTRGNQQNPGQPDADFFRVTTWRGLADNCARYLAKGRKVAVTGPVSVSTFQGNDGATRASLDVTAEDVEFLSSRNDTEGGYSAPAAIPAPTVQNNGFTAVETDELPF